MRSATKAQVSADKAFEMEFLFAREEIRVRMDYNRRLLAGQVTLIAALIAGGISLSGKDGTINSTLLQATAAAVTWLTAAFIFENTSNNSHVSVAAVFIHNVINRKYSVIGSGHPVYEWEAFLSLERQYSSNFLKKHFFVLDAAFLLNVMLTAIACISFYVSLRNPVLTVSKMAFVAFAIGLSAVGLAYWGHLTANSAWKMLVTRAEVDDLRRLYASPSAAECDVPSPGSTDIVAMNEPTPGGIETGRSSLPS